MDANHQAEITITSSGDIQHFRRLLCLRANTYQLQAAQLVPAADIGDSRVHSGSPPLVSFGIGSDWSERIAMWQRAPCRDKSFLHSPWRRAQGSKRGRAHRPFRSRSRAISFSLRSNTRVMNQKTEAAAAVRWRRRIDSARTNPKRGIALEQVAGATEPGQTRESVVMLKLEKCPPWPWLWPP